MKTIKADKEKNFEQNYVTSNIIDCVAFWNREGEIAIENNKSGKWGSEDTQLMAKTLKADDFLLEMVLTDCKTFCNSDAAAKLGEFECGRTRSHVWVHMNGERVLMIYFGL
jgi:hypothetical protein